MQFLMVGFLKPGAEVIPQLVQQRTTDFLAQPILDIATAGELLDGQGKRAGMMIMITCVDRAEAESFLRESPYLQAGLYDEFRIFEYQPEVGAL